VDFAVKEPGQTESKPVSSTVVTGEVASRQVQELHVSTAAAAPGRCAELDGGCCPSGAKAHRGPHCFPAPEGPLAQPPAVGRSAIAAVETALGVPRDHCVNGGLCAERLPMATSQDAVRGVGYARVVHGPRS
jgi:hypothetical protein